MEPTVRRSVFYSLVIGAALFLTSGVPASATGYWNMPSSCCQLLGYGCGAGYHAPLVLGPINWSDWCTHNEVRLPYSPAVPYGWSGCSQGGSGFAAPTLMEPAPVSVPPAVEPMTRRHRPLFLR